MEMIFNLLYASHSPQHEHNYEIVLLQSLVIIVNIYAVFLQVSKDGLNWTTLYTHVDDGSLNEPGSTSSWPLEPPAEETQGWRHVRLQQTGKNASGQTHYLSLSGFEIYGTVTGVCEDLGETPLCQQNASFLIFLGITQFLFSVHCLVFIPQYSILETESFSVCRCEGFEAPTLMAALEAAYLSPDHGVLQKNGICYLFLWC